MKTSKIGDLNFKKYKTEIFATTDVIKRLEKDDISTSNLIPAAWFWYDSELFPSIDENSDGKPDERFGKEFKLIYFTSEDNASDIEKESLLRSTTTIKGIKINYIGLKNAPDKSKAS
jgi:hypothetical protein